MFVFGHSTMAPWDELDLDDLVLWSMLNLPANWSSEGQLHTPIIDGECYLLLPYSSFL